MVAIDVFAIKGMLDMPLVVPCPPPPLPLTELGGLGMRLIINYAITPTLYNYVYTESVLFGSKV